MSEPTKGRIVHFVGHGADPVHCAAMVVRVWGTGPDACVNLCVFRDGTNDRNIVMPPGHENDMVFWATSVVRSAFVDELGYLSKQAWTAVKALVAASIEKNAAAHPNDPVGLIRAVFDDVAAQTPSIAAAGASLALHGVVTAMVAAL
jgi:hypothetical protein